MSFYNHITTVEIAERGALSAMPIGTAVRNQELSMHTASLSHHIDTFGSSLHINTVGPKLIFVTGLVKFVTVVARHI